MKKVTLNASLPFDSKSIFDGFDGFGSNGSIAVASVLLAGDVQIEPPVHSKLLNAKIPVNLFYFIDFVANRSNSTRTNVVISLLEAGAQAAFEGLPETEQKKFYDDLVKSTFEVEI